MAFEVRNSVIDQLASRGSQRAVAAPSRAGGRYDATSSWTYFAASGKQSDPSRGLPVAFASPYGTRDRCVRSHSLLPVVLRNAHAAASGAPWAAHSTRIRLISREIVLRPAAGDVHYDRATHPELVSCVISEPKELRIAELRFIARERFLPAYPIASVAVLRVSRRPRVEISLRTTLSADRMYMACSSAS